MKIFLLKNEIKATLLTFIIFSSFVFILLLLSFVLYPLPINIENETLKKILFIPEDVKNKEMYYAMVMEYFIIIISLMSAVLSTKTIVNDKKSGYDEYLFSLPLDRKAIFYNKLLAITIESIMFNLIFNILSFSFNAIFNFKISTFKMFEINTALFLSNITFLSIGVLVGSLIKPNHIYLKNILIILFLLLLAIPERIYNISFLRYFNPFSYFKLLELINSGYKISFITISGCIIIFSISISKTTYLEYDVLKQK